MMNATPIAKRDTGSTVRNRAAPRGVVYRAFRALLLPLLAVALTGCAGKPENGRAITVFKSADCGCCEEWIGYLRDRGYDVSVRNVTDMTEIKVRYGIPAQMQTCHTAVVDGYLVEGHVPADSIERMLEEKPAFRGLAVPGMPPNSPGMGFSNGNSFDVFSFDASGRSRWYARG